MLKTILVWWLRIGVACFSLMVVLEAFFTSQSYKGEIWNSKIANKIHCLLGYLVALAPVLVFIIMIIKKVFF